MSVRGTLPSEALVKEGRERARVRVRARQLERTLSLFFLALELTLTLTLFFWNFPKKMKSEILMIFLKFEKNSSLV